MKNLNKILMVFIALSAVAVAGCNKEDEEVKTDPNSVETIGYVKIDVRDINLTRADEEYKNGTDDEDKIESVVFMFFTDDGKQTQFPKRIEGLSGENSTEKGVSLVSNKIVTLVGAETPSSVMAVVNAPADIEVQLQSKTMEEVRNIVGTYEVSASGPFMMTNSVYRNSDGSEVCATPITKIYSSLTEAVDEGAQSVDIYVERVNAKIQIEQIEDEVFKSQTVTLADGSTVSLKLNVKGIEIGKMVDKSYLYKDIKDLDGNFNSPGHYRFNWANTPSELTFNSLTTGQFKDGNQQVTKYLMENTLDGNSPRLVITCQLTDEDDKTYPLVLWQGLYYAESKFPKVLASALQAKGYKIKVKAEGGEGTASIPEEYLIWASKDEHKAKYNSKDESERVKYYQGWMHLDPDKIKDVEFIDTTDENKESSDVVEEINAELFKEYNRVYFWNDGLCYMFTSVKDSQSSGVYDGVVRNTWYQISIGSIEGLGIPSFNPDLEIDYDVPNPEWYYIGARIKALKWRISQYEVNIK